MVQGPANAQPELALSPSQNTLEAGLSLRMQADRSQSEAATPAHDPSTARGQDMSVKGAPKPYSAGQHHQSAIASMTGSLTSPG